MCAALAAHPAHARDWTDCRIAVTLLTGSSHVSVLCRLSRTPHSNPARSRALASSPRSFAPPPASPLVMPPKKRAARAAAVDAEGDARAAAHPSSSAAVAPEAAAHLAAVTTAEAAQRGPALSNLADVELQLVM